MELITRKPSREPILRKSLPFLNRILSFQVTNATKGCVKYKIESHCGSSSFSFIKTTNVDRAEQSLELVRVFHVDLEARPQISQLGIWDPFWGGTLFKKEQE